MPSKNNLDAARVKRAVAQALDRGATRPLGGSARSWRTNYAANCSNPVIIEHTGRRVKLTPGAKSVHTVDMTERGAYLHELEVPCRQCENCLRRRAAHWRLRAISEIKSAPRSWFGTLTLSPDMHARVAAACRLHASRNGDDWDILGTERQYISRHRVISREITLYLKRLRKESGSNLRFCCVAEAHKTGLPHYHMLVHEGSSAPVKHAQLSGQWRVGFTNWKLVDETNTRPASYVTKYLHKSALARIRASLDYGQPTTSSPRNIS